MPVFVPFFVSVRRFTERDSGRVEEVLERQVRKGLEGVASKGFI